MGEVIRNTTSQLTAGDLAALVAYLRYVAPLPDDPGWLVAWLRKS